MRTDFEGLVETLVTYGSSKSVRTWAAACNRISPTTAARASFQSIRGLANSPMNTDTTYRYPGNSTARMLENLRLVPGADLAKLQTFECPSWELRPSDIASTVDFVFIDGEHTNAAATRDFHAVRRLVSRGAVIAFHDCNVVLDAILNVRCTTAGWWCHYPDSSVIAVALGTSSIPALRAAGWTEQLPVPRFYRLHRAAARLARMSRPAAPME